ncbi:MAG: hypothetical protein NTY07_04865, partial [Bacteroidia bacterium]|nr:hypothetical protein [Bacteroidia bacterium]
LVSPFYALANVAMLTLTPGILSKGSQHASSVAPVVTTSSTSNKCLPVSKVPFLTLKIPLTFSYRSNLPFRVWDAL